MNYGLEVKKNNPVAFSVIDNAFTRKTLSHAYLFSGPKNYEIINEPLFLVQELISEGLEEKRNPLTFADLIVIDGSSRMITKDEVLNAINSLSRTSLEVLGIKVLLIKNIENGNHQSLNSLLKFIEEPTQNTYIIATTNNVSQVLSTIRSRSQVVNLQNISRKQFIELLISNNVKPSNARILSLLTSDVEEAKKISESKDFFDSKNFSDGVESIITLTGASIRNKNRIFTELFRLLKKNNYKHVLLIISAFFNDIWKLNDVEELTFQTDEAVIEQFSNSNFNFQKALSSINDFIIRQDNNVNFDLYKQKLFIELEECYE